MPFQFKATVSRVGNSNMLILPKPLCDQYGLEKGDELLLIATEDGFYIPRKAKPIDDSAIYSIEKSVKNLIDEQEGRTKDRTRKQEGKINARPK